jgi:hypothetical protein
MFEYDYVTFDTTDTFWNTDFIKECNQMGAKFWELVTVIHTGNSGVAIFKRPSYGTS